MSYATHSKGSVAVCVYEECIKTQIERATQKVKPLKLDNPAI